MLMVGLNSSCGARAWASHAGHGPGPGSRADDGHRGRFRVIIIAFFLGSALAGAAGLIFGLYYNFTSYVIGYTAGLRAFTAAVLGGIGSIPGAMLGASSSG